MTAQLLSRIELVLTTSLHAVFPPLCAGLGLVLVVLEVIWLRTGNETYRRIAHFWIRLLATFFVVTLVSEFALGTGLRAHGVSISDLLLNHRGPLFMLSGALFFFLACFSIAFLILRWGRCRARFHAACTLTLFIALHGFAVWTTMVTQRLTSSLGALSNPPEAAPRIVQAVLGGWNGAACLFVCVTAIQCLARVHRGTTPCALLAGLLLLVATSSLQLAVWPWLNAHWVGAAISATILLGAVVSVRSWAQRRLATDRSCMQLLTLPLVLQMAASISLAHSESFAHILNSLRPNATMNWLVLLVCIAFTVAAIPLLWRACTHVLAGPEPAAWPEYSPPHAA